MTATQSQIREALVYFQGQQIAWKTDKRAPLYDTAVEVLQSALDTQKPAGDAAEALDWFNGILDVFHSKYEATEPDKEAEHISTICAALAGKPKDGGDVTGDTSDGYHTFNELYEHRHALFAALLRCYPTEAWKSKKHDDGTMFDGWFIAGIHTPDGNATYHIPMRLWDAFQAHEVDTAPKWDGHTPQDVIDRIGTLTADNAKRGE